MLSEAADSESFKPLASINLAPLSESIHGAMIPHARSGNGAAETVCQRPTQSYLARGRSSIAPWLIVMAPINNLAMHHRRIRTRPAGICGVTLGSVAGGSIRSIPVR